MEIGTVGAGFLFVIVSAVMGICIGMAGLTAYALFTMIKEIFAQ